MVEVLRARTAPGPREESSACLMQSSFMLGPPPCDRTLMSTRYKPLPVHVDCLDGGPASALLETALPVRYFSSLRYDLFSKKRARLPMRNEQGYNFHIGGGRTPTYLVPTENVRRRDPDRDVAHSPSALSTSASVHLQYESCIPAHSASEDVLAFLRRDRIVERKNIALEVPFQVVLKQAHRRDSRHGLEVACIWYSSGFGRTGVVPT